MAQFNEGHILDMGEAETEAPSDFGKDPVGQHRRWMLEITLAEKETEKWFNRGKKIIKRYRDQEEMENRVVERTATSYNILWSNIQTLQPALYSQTPKPQVERRFKDGDPLGRVASQVLERATSYAVQDDYFDPVMRAVRDDYLLVGRGTAWIRYVPHFSNVREDIDPDSMQAMGETDVGAEATGGEDIQEDEQGQFRMREELDYEEVVCDYVYWEDFGHTPARRWDEVRAVWRKVYMNRDQLVDRFGAQVGNEIGLDYASHAAKKLLEEEEGVRKEAFKKAEIYEIWSKEDKKVYWLSKSYGKIIEQKNDPLKLNDFFPCPRPLYATQTTNTLIPIPDYVLYQDQAKELDDLTARIDLLTNSMRIMGCYDSSFESLQRLMDEHAENELIPVDNWPSFQQQGGFQGVMQLFPVQDMAQVLQTLVQLREQIKQDLYEITGISDIVRGQSAPQETATAQQIKGQFATARLRDRQQEVQRFARDLIALQAEVIAEHFSPQTLALISGAELMSPDVMQGFTQAVELLRNDALRTFRVTIETDSTVALDEDLEKQNRSEVVQTIGGFMQQGMMVAQQAPAMVPFMGETLLWLVRAFRTGRNLESSLEQAIAAASQPPPPEEQGPDPEMQKLQAQLQLKQQELQMEAQTAQAKMQQDGQLKQAEIQQKFQAKMQELQVKQQESEAKMSLEMQKMQKDIEVALQKLQNDFMIKQMELQHKKEMDNKPSEVKRAVFTTNPETGDREAIIGSMGSTNGI